MRFERPQCIGSSTFIGRSGIRIGTFGLPVVGVRLFFLEPRGPMPVCKLRVKNPNLAFYFQLCPMFETLVWFSSLLFPELGFSLSKLINYQAE